MLTINKSIAMNHNTHTHTLVSNIPCPIICTIISYVYIGRQHRKDIDLNLKPFAGNNNINNYIFRTKKNVQFKTSNKYLLLLLLSLYSIQYDILE